MVAEGLVIAVLGGIAGAAVGHWVTSAVHRASRPRRGPAAGFRRSVRHARLPLRVWRRDHGGRDRDQLVAGVARVAGRRARGAPRRRQGAVRRARSAAAAQRARRRADRRFAGAADRRRRCSRRRLGRAKNIDLGFDADHLITARVDVRQIGYDEAQGDAFYEELLRASRSWGDVASASVGFSVPMSYLVGRRLGLHRRAAARRRARSRLPSSSITPATSISTTMQIPVVRGRAFRRDDEGEHETTRRLAIVNEAFAERYWPGQDPIGKRLRMFNPTDPLLEVVGVVRNSKYVLVFEKPRPFVLSAARPQPDAADAARAGRRATRRCSRRGSSARFIRWRPTCRSPICGRCASHSPASSATSCSRSARCRRRAWACSA